MYVHSTFSVLYYFRQLPYSIHGLYIPHTVINFQIMNSLKQGNVMALTYTGVACFLFCIIIIIVNFDIGQHAGGWEPRLYIFAVLDMVVSSGK